MTIARSLEKPICHTVGASVRANCTQANTCADMHTLHWDKELQLSSYETFCLTFFFLVMFIASRFPPPPASLHCSGLLPSQWQRVPCWSAHTQIHTASRDLILALVSCFTFKTGAGSRQSLPHPPQLLLTSIYPSTPSPVCSASLHSPFTFFQSEAFLGLQLSLWVYCAEATVHVACHKNCTSYLKNVNKQSHCQKLTTFDWQVWKCAWEINWFYLLACL